MLKLSAETVSSTTEESSAFYHITFGELLLSIATFGLAMVTVILVIATYKLWKATIKAVETESNNTTKVAITSIRSSERARLALLASKAEIPKRRRH